MNDLSAHVQTDTRALIWFPKPDLDSHSPHYRQIDYLCDGILTSSLPSLKEKSSLLLIGKNFGQPLMVFIAKEIVKKELESFIGLIPKDGGEILVVDDSEQMSFLKGMMAADVWAKLKRV